MQSINREILRLSIPNIISNISVPLLSTVDTALMGRLSEQHLGAVGLGAMIFNFIYWNFGFLRMGTTGITAQAFGKKDSPEMILTLNRALIVAFILAVFVLLFQSPLGKLSFHLMNVSEGQMVLVKNYYYARIWAAPATLGLYAFMGWFFGMQNAIYPLILTVFINVVNIVLSYLFVHHYGMDVEGVAYGTVFAQYAGLFLAMALFWKKYRSYAKLYTHKAALKIEALKQFLSINSDIFIRTFCLTFAFGFFYSQSSLSGEMILAVNVILLQFLNWMSYGVDGFAYASESLVGKYAGAQNEQKLKEVIRWSFIWGLVLAMLYSLIFWIFGEQLLWVFTNKVEVVEATKVYLFWMVLMPVLATPCYIWDGIYIGLTASKAMRNSMLIALVIYLLSYYGLIAYQNHGLWAALMIFLFMRGIIQWRMYSKLSECNDLR